MELETDLRRIEKLAKERKDANWAFRCFLKASDLSSEEIDSVVHRHYKAVAARIDCRECGNCCRVSVPVMRNKDIERLAIHLQINEEQFTKEYLIRNEEGEGQVFRSTPCPFLNGNFCTVYEHRPRDCRSYPHLQKKDFVFRLNQAYSNRFICPIVFNVYEKLKQDLWRRRRHG